MKKNCCLFQELWLSLFLYYYYFFFFIFFLVILSSFKTSGGEGRAFLSDLVTVQASVCLVWVLAGEGRGAPVVLFFSRIMAGSRTLLYKLDPGL